MVLFRFVLAAFAVSLGVPASVKASQVAKRGRKNQKIECERKIYGRPGKGKGKQEWMEPSIIG